MIKEGERGEEERNNFAGRPVRPRRHYGRNEWWKFSLRTALEVGARDQILTHGSKGGMCAIGGSWGRLWREVRGRGPYLGRGEMREALERKGKRRIRK